MTFVATGEMMLGSIFLFKNGGKYAQKGNIFFFMKNHEASFASINMFDDIRSSTS
jgi:hypothetical protein